MALKLIKNKIKSTERTSKVTKAMEAVSAVKMRKSQEKALGGRPYAETAIRVLERVSHVQDARKHALFASHDVGKTCVIVVTSDKGLAGSLNSAVLKEATAYIANVAQADTELICFGKKSYEHFTRRGYTVPLHYLNVQDDVKEMARTNKIMAIKLHRDRTGAGLAEAKDAIEKRLGNGLPNS